MSGPSRGVSRGALASRTRQRTRQTFERGLQVAVVDVVRFPEIEQGARHSAPHFESFIGHHRANRAEAGIVARQTHQTSTERKLLQWIGSPEGKVRVRPRCQRYIERNELQVGERLRLLCRASGKQNHH